MTTLSPSVARERTNGRAIAVMSAGVLCLVANDTLAKWLTDFYNPIQIIFMRNLIAVPMVAAIILALRGPSAFITPHLKVHAVRGLMVVTAAFLFFSGLAELPLAEATSIGFAAPIFITALSVPLLGEPVGWRRWAAVLFGFAGVLIIVRPGAAAFHPASLYVVGTAILYAFYMISARWIGPGERFGTMSFYVLLFPLIYAAIAVPFVWRPVDPSHLLVFGGLAVVGSLGVSLIGHAFRLGDAAVVAPFDYSALLWASLLGWLIWGEIPGSWTYAGAAVIVASGIYIVWRETRTRRETADS